MGRHCPSPTTFWQTRSQEMFEKIVEYVVVPDSGYDDVVIFGSSRAVIVEYSRRTTFVRFHPLTVTGRPTRYLTRACVCATQLRLSVGSLWPLIMCRYVGGELSATKDDYGLLTKLNEATSEEYVKMAATANGK